MEGEPKITIVTAAWRKEGLRRVIECIDNQTYKNWEHIIVNDNSREIHELYFEEPVLFANLNRHLITFGIRTHWFGGICRNVGAMIAFSYIPNRERTDNEWICFLDDDNLWEKDHLENIVNAIKENPDRTLIGVNYEIRGYKDPNYRKEVNTALAPDNCDLGCFAYKKSLFEKYGYFNPRQARTIKYDWEFIEKIYKGEGKEKTLILRNKTFIYYHKEK